MSKENRAEKWILKISLRELRGQISSVPDFTGDELRELCGQKRLLFPTTSPLHFSKVSVQMQLTSFFTYSIFPLGLEISLKFGIITFLKANKPPSDLGFFIPISLTSCVSKLFKRMISARMYSICI